MARPKGSLNKKGRMTDVERNRRARLNMKRWRENSSEEEKDRRRDQEREYGRLVRLEAIQVYGGKCQGCGIDDERVLCFDHILDDGAELRKRGQPTGRKLASWLKRNGWPLDFQLLCWNCNFLKLQRINEVKRKEK